MPISGTFRANYRFERFPGLGTKNSNHGWTRIDTDEKERSLRVLQKRLFSLFLNQCATGFIRGYSLQ